MASPIRIIAVLLATSASACAMTAEGGDVITLENAAGKADGSEHQAIPLSSTAPGATLRFTCDEGVLDRCEIVIDAYPDLATESSAHEYLKSLGMESYLDLVAIRVYQPDGERAELLLSEDGEETPRDVLRMRSEWHERLYSEGAPYLFPHVEGEFMHPGQFVIETWQKGEFVIELDHLPLPDAMPDAREIHLGVYWE